MAGGRRRIPIKYGFVAACVALVLAVLLVQWPERIQTPILTPAYRMAFHNLTFDNEADGSLELALDPDGTVTGEMTVNPPLFGTGALEGSLDGRRIAFTLGGGAEYKGAVEGDGVIVGTYTYPRQDGRWRAEPVDRHVERSGLPRWLWLVVMGFLMFSVASVKLRVGERRP